MKIIQDFKAQIGALPKTVVLVGLMGAGKTSIGKRLADRLEADFIDVDAEIEAAAGCSIAEFFSRYGETEFRRGEERVIERLLSRPPCVLATGGGAFMSSYTRNSIRKHGLSIWLRADLETLYDRVARRSGRPLLETDDPKKTLGSLIDSRYPVYGEADIIVESQGTNLGDTVDQVYRSLFDYLIGGRKAPCQ